MTTREDLRQLVEQLPEQELETARRMLEYLRDTGDPVAQAFATALRDDEPETTEERLAVEEAKQELRRGRGRPWEAVREELGG